MKAIFGVLALVIVLAIVGSIAKKQMSASGLAARSADAASQAAGSGAAMGADSSAAPVAFDPGSGTVREQSATMQQQARERTVRALQQGVDRNSRAEP